MTSLLRRDLLLSRDRGWSWSLGLIFFITYASLLVFALPSGSSLSGFGPSVIWSGAIYGLLLTAPTTFASDIESGAIDHLRLEGHSLFGIVLCRAISTGLTSVLPLLPTAAILGVLYATPSDVIAKLILGLLLASPALSAYTVFIGILVTGRKAGGLVGTLVALPLLAPLVMFGVAAARVPSASLATSVEFLALAGLSLIGTVVALSGAVAALRIQVE